MQIKLTLITSILVCSLATIASGESPDSSPASQDGLQIEIQSPVENLVSTSGERTIEVEGVPKPALTGRVVYLYFP